MHKTHPNKMVNAVVGIIFRDGKVLVAERPHGKPYAGFWEFPGGKIEANETSEQALYRELYEELGITIVKAAQLFTHAHAYPDKTVLLHLWSVTGFTGEPQAKEQQSLRWVTSQEINQLNILEGNKAIVEQVFLSCPKDNES